MSHVLRLIQESVSTSWLLLLGAIVLEVLGTTCIVTISWVNEAWPLDDGVCALWM